MIVLVTAIGIDTSEDGSSKVQGIASHVPSPNNTLTPLHSPYQIHNYGLLHYPQKFRASTDDRNRAIQFASSGLSDIAPHSRGQHGALINPRAAASCEICLQARLPCFFTSTRNNMLQVLLLSDRSSQIGSARS